MAPPGVKAPIRWFTFDALTLTNRSMNRDVRPSFNLHVPVEIRGTRATSFAPRRMAAKSHGMSRFA